MGKCRIDGLREREMEICRYIYLVDFFCGGFLTRTNERWRNSTYPMFELITCTSIFRARRDNKGGQFYFQIWSERD